MVKALADDFGQASSRLRQSAYRGGLTRAAANRTLNANSHPMRAVKRLKINQTPIKATGGTTRPASITMDVNSLTPIDTAPIPAVPEDRI